MPIAIGTGLIVVPRSWTDFKKIIDGSDKQLLLQQEYSLEQHATDLFAVDGIIIYTCVIYDSGYEPFGWSGGQISDNADALSEFTDDWLATANKQINLSNSTNVKHFNGSATTSNSTVNFTVQSKSVLIQNMLTSGTDNLLVSFDGGVNFKTLFIGSGIQMDIITTSCVIKTTGGTIPYEILVVF